MANPVEPPAQPSAASPWVLRFAGLIPAGGPVLDLACGAGRHARLLLARGHPVAAVDIDVSRLADLADLAGLAGRQGLTMIEADLESGPWPLEDQEFAGVVVTNYLWRPLLPRIVAAVAPGGALIYETFAKGNERFGRPAKPEFLLDPGELLEAVRGRLTVIAYENLAEQKPRPAMRQRIAARREAG